MRGLVGRTVEILGIEIVAGRLRPGVALPNETDWSAQLGVSRTVLREAVRVLASKGLVNSRPRTGTRVRDPEGWNALDPDLLAWQLEAAPSERLVRELFELRRVIEPAIAAMAAERASAEHVAALDAALAEMAETADDPFQFLGPDVRFHQTILASVDNRMLRSLASAIETALTLSLQLSLETPRGQHYSLPLHGAVLEAIRLKNGAGAREAMHRLIDDAEEDALRTVAASPGQEPQARAVRRGAS